MIFKKIKKAVEKPIKFAFNLKVFLLIAPFIILTNIINVFFSKISIGASVIIFFIQFLLDIFILFFSIKMYLDFTKVERNRIKLSQLKEDFKEVLITLIGAIIGIPIIFFLSLGILGIFLFYFNNPLVMIFIKLFGATILILLSLSIFYLMPSIIIGKNKLINAIKESINLMKNNFLYSISRIMLLIIIQTILVFVFFVTPMLYLIYKTFTPLNYNFFLMMDKTAKNEFIYNTFLTFASENIILSIIIIILIFCGLVIIKLFINGFISNMYLDLTSKKQKKSMKKIKK